MTLNTVKPRSAIRRLSPSMVCATDLLLGLVMTPSEDCVLSSIRFPFEVGRSCAQRRELPLSDSRSKVRARPRRTLHPPLGGARPPPAAAAPIRDTGLEADLALSQNSFLS